MTNDNNDSKPNAGKRKQKRSKKAAATKAAATKSVVTDTEILNFFRTVLKNKNTARRMIAAL